MATSVKLSTTGTPSQVIIHDLGRKIFNHPAIDYELIGEYSIIDLAESADLQAAVDGNEVTIVFNGKTVSDVRILTAEDDTFTGTTGTAGSGVGLVPDDGTASTGNRFLSDDGTFKVPAGAAGAEYFIDTAPAGTSTDDLWVTIVQISETFDGGDYIVRGTFSWTTTNSSTNFIAELYVDTNKVWDINPRPFYAGELTPGAFSHKVNLTAGSHDIYLRYKCSATNKLAWIYNTVLEVETEGN